MLLLEINEFSPELMQRVAGQASLPHLQQLLAMRRSITSTADDKERFGLDPWVQWVSIHTGVPSGVHGVRHLGCPPQQHPQLWETLDKEGYSTAVWGAMNASRGACSRQTVFFPDPWTFGEQASPPCLNGFLAFPRYYAKHYGHLRIGPLLWSLLRLLGFFLRPAMWKTAVRSAVLVTKTVLRYGFRHHLLFALFDWVSTQVFLVMHRKRPADFSVLFLNALAHLQHNRWPADETYPEDFLQCFRLIDQLLGDVFRAFGGQAIVVANALSQVNCESANEYLYRQKQPRVFLECAGLEPMAVEQLMTNDAHVFFRNADEATTAASILNDARVGGEKVFHAEASGDNIFYQVSLWNDLASSSLLEINGKQLRFFSFFDKVVRRTGAHVREGAVFSNNPALPAHLENHALHEHVLAAMRSTGASQGAV